MSIESILETKGREALVNLFGESDTLPGIQLQHTRREFEGDWTIVVFPFLKLSGKGPEETARMLGDQLVEMTNEIASYNVVKGFLNLSLKDEFWINEAGHLANADWWRGTKKSKSVMVEYSSPNTNKPLHLGHIRNNLLGWSVAEILKANGYDVKKVNLVNDRGIHICKSMLAWQRWGNNETPDSVNLKGDKLVGNYYVRFDQELKKEVADRIARGIEEKEAEQEAPLMQEAREMLRKWEAGDEEVRKLWATMNQWVYDGFEITYQKMGVDFDDTYYESNTYLLGKQKVEEALKRGELYQKEDGSVWVDLEADGLDQKLLLRSDGTSVYMTQDIGTAIQRFESGHLDQHIYVVGNEQDYHFKALSLILKKMGYAWAENLYHLSYGMVDLPSGKMKSREGTVVDADDLIAEVVDTARQKTMELGKVEGLEDDEADQLFYRIGMGALKYFILKVDPKKKMLFNPEESIDFNGHTGPFIQYTHARIASVLRKGNEEGLKPWDASGLPSALEERERSLLKILFQFRDIVHEAGKLLSPAMVANYVYDLAKEFNQFYHECPILKAEDRQQVLWRLSLADAVRNTINDGMHLLGIEVPDRM
ncbi:MAG: arginine--tRNA ligase [Flavobacteriales bacterium]|nr:arginine--tRNA ligase [Flavobacteriales bacterium]